LPVAAVPIHTHTHTHSYVHRHVLPLTVLQ